MHRCYVCEGANPGRVFRREAAGSVARYPARFSGPPASANGGIAAGSLACPAISAATRDAGTAVALARISARLSAPVPVDTDLPVAVTAADGAFHVKLSDAGAVCMTGTVEVIAGNARPSPDDTTAIAPEHAATLDELTRIPVPDKPPFFEETGDHPIRGCFSCGPDNAAGLHIYPRVAADGITCAPWHASPEFDDGDGSVSPMIVASALDCSSGICMPVQLQRDLLDEDKFFLLGSLQVDFLRPAPVDRDYRVAAKAVERAGRKFYGASALVDDAGTPYAMAHATWIVAPISRTQAFGERRDGA